MGVNTNIAWYDSRMTSIRNAFNTIYWKNGFYSSDVATYKDDRLNALTILSGIADSTKFDTIVQNVLIPNKFASPHFEWMVEAAMCKVGKYKEALSRMKERYEGQVNTAGLTTLYETFPKGGTYNHAWNASNTVLSKYIAGTEPTKAAWSEYKVCPTLVHLTSFNSVIPSVKGNISVDVSKTDKKYSMNLISPQQTIAIVGFPKKTFNIFELKAANQTIWKNGNYVDGVSGISWYGEDENFILFKAEPGTWNFEATGNGYVTIPTTLEAEDYNLGVEGVAYHDVDVEDKLGQGRPGEGVDVGLLNDVKYVGFVEAGEWLTYNINVGISQKYDFLFDYASDTNNSEISLWLNDTELISSHVFKQTAGLNNFKTDTIPGVMLMSGLYTLKIKVKTGGFNLDKIQIKIPGPIQEPYNGTPIAIPGTFEAENYDLGGEGLAYHDSDITNTSAVYRSNGVDIGIGGTGYVISNIYGGEWLEYTVDVKDDGFYDMHVAYASKLTTGILGAEFPGEGIMLFNDLALPQTSATNWTTYNTVTKKEIPMTKGIHVLRINMVARGYNLDKFSFVKSGLASTPNVNETILKIHPNPSANGLFYLSESQKWEVLSIAGAKLITGEGTSIDLSAFQKGIYIAKTENSFFKLIKE